MRASAKGNDLFIGHKVRQFLSKNGVSKANMADTLAKLLNLSRSQAYRKLAGASSWKRTELMQVAEGYESTAQAILDIDDNSEVSQEKILTAAILRLGAQDVPVMANIGPGVDVSYRGEYVAYQNPKAEWIVAPVHAKPDSLMCFSVDHVELVLGEKRAYRIAVVDDDPGSVDSLCDFLADRGMEAEGFYTATDFEQALARKSFDAYVLDWFLDDTDAHGLIEQIKSSSNANAPIMLLTGIEGPAEADIADIIKKHDVICHFKPTRLSIITANLEKVLAVTE